MPKAGASLRSGLAGGRLLASPRGDEGIVAQVDELVLVGEPVDQVEQVPLAVGGHPEEHLIEHRRHRVTVRAGLGR